MRYILDPDGNPLPPGVIGEIYVGGAGVSRGYINREELNAQRFVKDYFTDCSVDSARRLYRTGDNDRFLLNGDLEYLGRIDDQVKIRDFRIEIGEIETAISQYFDVHSAIVLIDADAQTSQKQLIAYVVFTNYEQQPSIETLRHHLKQHLPDYMIPSQIIYLEKFPLTSNGKIDKKALPKPGIQRENLEVAFVPAATSIESTLANI